MLTALIAGIATTTLLTSGATLITSVILELATPPTHRTYIARYQHLLTLACITAAVVNILLAVTTHTTTLTPSQTPIFLTASTVTLTTLTPWLTYATMTIHRGSHHAEQHKGIENEELAAA